MSVVQGPHSLEFDANLCIGCGSCTLACPEGVFELESDQSRMANPERCTGCCQCQLNCQGGAIRLTSLSPNNGLIIQAALMQIRKEETSLDEDKSKE
jgi:ferredoxin